MNAVVTRSGWGARKPRGVPTTVPISSRTATCTHHDGSHPIAVTTMEAACALMRKDQDFHMDTNGWDDIGYNFLVISAPGYAIDGRIFEGRGRDVVGAHCKDWNTPWIGIQIAVGGSQRPSNLALNSARELHEACVKGAGHQLAKKGHFQGFPTACPGTFLKAWLAAGMPTSSTPVPIPVIVKAINVVKAIIKTPARAVAKATNMLVVDGDLGPATIREIQGWLGAKEDGVLGPATWRLFQRRLVVGIDGIPGPTTWKAIQAMVGARQDGAPGKATITALQRYLNANY